MIAKVYHSIKENKNNLNIIKKHVKKAIFSHSADSDRLNQDTPYKYNYIRQEKYFFF